MPPNRNKTGRFMLIEALPLMRLVATLDAKIMDLALNSEFSDFEDAIQYFSALQNEVELLLTRSLKYYKQAQITVLTAQDFINLQ